MSLVNIDNNELLPDHLRRSLHVFLPRLCDRTVWAREQGNRCHPGHELMQQIQPLSTQHAEAQHPKFFSYQQATGRLPHLAAQMNALIRG
jgi:hypothetical protein